MEKHRIEGAEDPDAQKTAALIVGTFDLIEWLAEGVRTLEAMGRIREASDLEDLGVRIQPGLSLHGSVDFAESAISSSLFGDLQATAHAKKYYDWLEGEEERAAPAREGAGGVVDIDKEAVVHHGEDYPPGDAPGYPYTLPLQLPPS